MESSSDLTLLNSLLYIVTNKIESNRGKIDETYLLYLNNWAEAWTRNLSKTNQSLQQIYEDLKTRVTVANIKAPIICCYCGETLKFAQPTRLDEKILRGCSGKEMNSPIDKLDVLETLFQLMILKFEHFQYSLPDLIEVLRAHYARNG